MPEIHRRLQPGTLREALAGRTRHALACGALLPIATETAFVEQAGVRFMVRVATSLARKDAARTQQTPASDREIDPFLPYDPDLFVADILDTHLGLLNKFNVIDNHLLIVTRLFEDQEMLLTLADFEALWVCLAEFDGLGFYNGGEVAGASQRHKHLQLVPLPLVDGDSPIPVAPLLIGARLAEGAMGAVPGLPFRHVFVRLDSRQWQAPAAAARIAYEHYRRMLDAAGMAPVPTEEGLRQSAPYNLLATRSWMLFVPRTCECWNGVSINALGYAGSLFVRTRDQLEAVTTYGPMNVLREVSVPLPNTSRLD